VHILAFLPPVPTLFLLTSPNSRIPLSFRLSSRPPSLPFPPFRAYIYFRQDENTPDLHMRRCTWLSVSPFSHPNLPFVVRLAQLPLLLRFPPGTSTLKILCPCPFSFQTFLSPLLAFFPSLSGLQTSDAGEGKTQKYSMWSFLPRIPCLRPALFFSLRISPPTCSVSQNKKVKKYLSLSYFCCCLRFLSPKGAS